MKHIPASELFVISSKADSDGYTEVHYVHPARLNGTNWDFYYAGTAGSQYVQKADKNGHRVSVQEVEVLA